MQMYYPGQLLESTEIWSMARAVYRLSKHRHELVLPIEQAPMYVLRRMMDDPIEFAIAAQEGVVYILCRFGMGSWFSAPCLLSTKEIERMTKPLEQVTAQSPIETLQIVLVHPRWRRVQGIRTVGLPIGFVEILVENIRRYASPDLAHRGPIRAPEPRVELLLSMAMMRLTLSEDATLPEEDFATQLISHSVKSGPQW